MISARHRGNSGAWHTREGTWPAMNTLSSTSMPEVYRAWWGESVEQLAVARELLTLERHSSTVFHAWMALELAIKAVRLAPARIGDLDFLTYKLSTYTV